MPGFEEGRERKGLQMKNKRQKENQNERAVINWCRINKGFYRLHHWCNKAGIWMWYVSVENKNTLKEAYAETKAEVFARLKVQL